VGELRLIPPCAFCQVHLRHPSICMHAHIHARTGLPPPIQPSSPPNACRWYLHPTQHAFEMLLALVIFGPLLVVTYSRMVKQMRALRCVQNLFRSSL
jgi:hypothetical protein